MAVDILKAWDGDGLPEDFDDDEVLIMFNTCSGDVFLANSGDQTAMIDGNGVLGIWHHCPGCHHEGFKEDMKHEPEDGECLQFLKEIGVVVKGDDDE